MTPDLYRHVPKGRVANLKWRLWLLDEARKSQQVRDGLVAACRRDILFYLNAFAWTYDPRPEVKILPFITYHFQDRAIRFICKKISDSQRPDCPACDVVIEKSRDMGATWISLYIMEWLWHFHPDNSFLLVSNKAENVDKSGDPKSLLAKIDILHKHLPEWLMPAGWNARKHRLTMHLENPENGSTIDGVATTSNAGTGDRRTAMFIDEFSLIEEAAKLFEGTADTSRCRIFNFTCQSGTAHKSYELAQRTDLPKLRLGWWEHPEKNWGLYRYNPDTQQREFFECQPDGTLAKLPGPKIEYPEGHKFVDDGVLRSPVYDAEDKRRGNRQHMAVMWDIDYTGADTLVYPKSLIVELQREYACPPLWEGEVVYDRETGENPRLVQVEGGPVKLWCNPVRRADYFVMPPGSYGAGADLAEGVGKTPSCFSAIRQTTREKVLEFVTPFMGAEKFAVACVALCKLLATSDGYGARLCWESQGPGQRFGIKVIQLGYLNVWMRQPEGRITTRSSDTPGWNPSPENKRILHGDYLAALGAREVINRSYAALEECLKFKLDANANIVHKETQTDDPSGAAVNHGDRVIADALAYKMIGPMPIGSIPEPATDEIPVGSLAWRIKFHQDQERMEESLKGW